MNALKKILLTLFVASTLTTINAQTSNNLLGKWEANYTEGDEKVSVTYEFKMIKGELKCYSISIKNDIGEAGTYETLAMKDISFKNGKGRSKYLYTDEDGENHVFNAKLQLQNENTLSVSYSYWGYSDTERWKRLE